MYMCSFEGRFRGVGPALLFILSALVLTLPGRSGAQEVPSVQGVTSNLFTSDEVIELSLETNFVKLKADRGLDPEYRPAILTVVADDGSPRALDIKVKTRGHFRLETCRFPPLKVNLPKKSLAGTVFDGEDKIKLVTHCRDGDSDEQNVLEEYLAYRTYNVLTDTSFRVRLARITYVDSRGKDEPLTRYAFFIEEKEAIAQRLGGMMLDVPQVHLSNLSADASARMALFQYMVGNYRLGHGLSSQRQTVPGQRWYPCSGPVRLRLHRSRGCVVRQARRAARSSNHQGSDVSRFLPSGSGLLRHVL